MALRYSGYKHLPFITLSVAFIFVALWPIATQSGVPSFEQDWQWPVHRAQCAPYAKLGMQPWNPSGLGSAQAYPEPWAPYAIGGLLCTIAGPQTALALYLVLMFALAAVGIRWLCGTYGFGTCSYLCAVACYLGNPVLLNKLHAGHVHFIFSYALLPIFLAATRDANTANKPLVLGTLLGIASAQQQFFFFGILLGTLMALRYGARWFARTGLEAVVISLCFTSPQWILALTHGSSGNLAVYQPLWHWEFSQSVPFTDAVRFLGYIGGYDVGLPAWIRTSLWVLPLFAFGGAVGALIRHRGRAWLVATICGLLVVIGLYGPIGGTLVFAMQRLAIFAAFRELYTVEAVVILSYAMLTAVLVAMLGLNRKLLALSYAITVLVVFVGGCLAYYEARGMPTFAPTPAADAAIDRIWAARGYGRYLQIPGALPQSVIGSHTLGLSPFTLPIGSHPSAIDTLSEPPYASIIAGESRSLLPARLLTALGVSHILKVPNVVQRSNYEPQLQHVFETIVAGSQRRWDVIERSAQHVALLGPSSSVEVTNGRILDLNTFAQGVNPRMGWARTALWNNLPIWIFDRPAGIFTLRKDATVALHREASLLVGSATGQMQAEGCRRQRRLDQHYAVFRCNGTVSLHAVPPIVLSEAVSGVLIFERPVSGGRITVNQDNGYRLNVHVEAPRGAVLELRERQDSGWKCLHCNAIAARGDGYANAWIFPEGAHGDVVIEFSPAQSYYLALLLSFIVLVAAIIGVVVLLRQRQIAFRQSGPGAVAHLATSP